MKKAFSIAVSLCLLIMIYYFKIDVRELFKVFANSNSYFLSLGLASILPLVLLVAWRFQQLMPTGKAIPFVEAAGLTLSAGTLNILLPLKAGDIAKAVFMYDRGHFSGAMSACIVTFEKGLDMVCLLLWCMLGLFVYPHDHPAFPLLKLAVVSGFCLGTMLLVSSRFALFCFTCARVLLPSRFHHNLEQMSLTWVEIGRYFSADKWKTARVIAGSIMIWFVHLLQIWLFIKAMGASAPFFYNLGMSPLVLLAGMMPFTFAGMGTRDAALIFLFQSYLTAPAAAAVALLTSSRYILPAIAGLPFLDKYMRLVKMRWSSRNGALAQGNASSKGVNSGS